MSPHSTMLTKNNVSDSRACLTQGPRFKSSIIQVHGNELKLSQQRQLFCTRGRGEDYQGTGAKLNYPHRLPSNRAPPTPVVEFALVYSNCCGKLKPNVRLPHFSPDFTPSYFPAFCGMMGHAKIIHALASFFVRLPCHFGSMNHAKALRCPLR